MREGGLMETHEISEVYVSIKSLLLGGYKN